jgi:hypothetical protein
LTEVLARIVSHDLVVAVGRSAADARIEPHWLLPFAEAATER